MPFSIVAIDIGHLIEKVAAYAPDADTRQLDSAYTFAAHHHATQKRASGEPYITHPLAVAHMLADLKMDMDSVIAGLLHDVVEDTAATIQDIEKRFGKDVCLLVQGVTKLARIGLQSNEQKQAENFRRLVLAMSDDIRILMIKLCDRLHNMRTIRHIHSEESRRRVSLETLEIYAPLAERIGMKSMQEELQDLSFSQLNPDAYTIITNRIKHLHQLDKNIMDLVVQDLNSIMQKANIKAKIMGREKSPYSIWRKMQRKNMSFEQLCDVVAFRVLVNSIADCYQTLGVIHNEFFVIPGRFKDYISTPKPNNYQSLHTYVIGPNQRQIEIQIRTYAMQEVSEYGVAAHWQYKQGIRSKDGKKYRWVRSLLDILEHTVGDQEFLENTKLEMFHDQVFCFTPYGDLIALRRGSTPIDFAYAVHSDIGNRCKGVKINGKLMPLRTELRNGDQVEIIISPNQNPSPTWERFVVTGKAKTNIRRFLRAKKRSQFVSLGKSIFEKEFSARPKAQTNKVLDKLLKKTGLKEEDFYAHLGEGLISTHELTRFASPASDTEADVKDVIQVEGGLKVKTKLTKLKLGHRTIKELMPEMAISYGSCCYPLPGDKIKGVVKTGTGITIHRHHCETLKNFHGDEKNKLDLSWATHAKKEFFEASIFLVLHNAKGSLAVVSTLIAEKNGNIVNLSIKKRSRDFFDLDVHIQVNGTEHLNEIMAVLRMARVVYSVDRQP